MGAGKGVCLLGETLEATRVTSRRIHRAQTYDAFITIHPGTDTGHGIACALLPEAGGCTHAIRG